MGAAKKRKNTVNYLERTMYDTDLRKIKDFLGRYCNSKARYECFFIEKTHQGFLKIKTTPNAKIIVTEKQIEPEKIVDIKLLSDILSIEDLSDQGEIMLPVEAYDNDLEKISQSGYLFLSSEDLKKAG